MSDPDGLFPGFVERTTYTGDARLYARVGGQGPPLLLLHGYPETHAAWHKVAPALARHFTVVTPDLRGYGRSSCPPATFDHRAYSKQTMAHDMVLLMASLGFRRFAVMGHDRGARVAYRLALDEPDIVDRLVIIDIMTTLDQWQPEQQSTRSRISHWALLAQPAPIPETLIGANPIEWLESRFRRGTLARSLAPIDPRALDDYRRGLTDPDHIHAACEDYRAGASVDLEDDRASAAARSRVMCPTLLLWGTAGSLAEIADPIALWQPWCRSVTVQAIESGHFLAEENPVALLAAALPFLTATEA